MTTLWRSCVRVLEGDGFYTVAGGAFVGRHAFTDKLAEDRPDWDDRKELKNLRLQSLTR